MTNAFGLGDLATLAAGLDDPQVIDNIPPAQWRAMRETADNIAAAFDDVGGLTAGVVFALSCGASLEASVAVATNPMAEIMSQIGIESGPSSLTMIVFAFLARDVLAGERVT